MRKYKGVTLFELMISLAVLSIIFSFGAIYSHYFLVKNQLATTSHTITSAVRFSKNMALIKKQLLILEGLPVGAPFKLGMRLFIDKNKDKIMHDKSQIVREWRWPRGAFAVTFNGFISNKYLLFSPNQLDSALSGHFSIQAKDKKMQYIITLNRLGRIREEYQAS